MKKKMDLKNPKVRNPLIVALLGVAIVALWFNQLYQPAEVTINGLKITVQSKQDTLNTINNLKPKLVVLQKEIVLAQAKLDSLKSIFPDQKEIPKLIKELTKVSRASGIVATRFHPLPDIAKEYYIENRYNMEVVGGYHQLAEFFSFLANFNLIINLSSVIIASNPELESVKQDSNAAVSNHSVVAYFDMTTFSSKR